jgi:hypothetical protein
MDLFILNKDQNNCLCCHCVKSILTGAVLFNSLQADGSPSLHMACLLVLVPTKQVSSTNCLRIENQSQCLFGGWTSLWFSIGRQPTRELLHVETALPTQVNLG